MSAIDQVKREDDWDLVIEPTNNVFKLNLTQVWKYRDLLWLLVRRDFVSFYKQTILGPIWFFIQPLFTMGMYVFGGLAGISTDGLPQPLFYLVGITAWFYFSGCLVKTSTVFKDNSGIFPPNNNAFKHCFFQPCPLRRSIVFITGNNGLLLF